MIETISELDTKIKIIQVYGKCMLYLLHFFGNKTIVVLSFLSFTLNYYGLLLSLLFLDVPLQPILEHLTYTNPIVIKREYTILTYVFGINYLRDIIDSLLRQVVMIFIIICIKILTYKKTWIYQNWLKKYFIL